MRLIPGSRRQALTSSSTSRCNALLALIDLRGLLATAAVGGSNADVLCRFSWFRRSFIDDDDDDDDDVALKRHSVTKQMNTFRILMIFLAFCIGERGKVEDEMMYEGML